MFVFNFGVGLLEQSVKLGRFVIFDFLGAFYSVFVVGAFFSAAVAKGNLPKTPAIVSLANFQICCDIQGSHLIGCL